MTKKQETEKEKKCIWVSPSVHKKVMHRAIDEDKTAEEVIDSVLTECQPCEAEDEG
jgi:hypothetical protein